MDIDRLKTRIQALRAKTVANGCTEPEALLAAAKVAELLDQYDLSLSEVELRSGQCERLVIRPTGKQRRPPMDFCIGAIAAFADCKVWRETGPDGRADIVFFGLTPDLEVARAIYDIIDATMKSEAEAYKRARKVISYRHDEGRSFLTGMALAIGDTLLAMKAERDRANHAASGRDLVLVKRDVVAAEFDRLGLAMKESGASGKKLSAAAFDAGIAAGERFELGHRPKKR